MPKAGTARLYECDFYSWAMTQARALRHGSFKELDLPNLAEEVEGMARSEERELESRLEGLVAHLLKWAYQPVARSKSWRLTLAEQRFAIRKLLKRNPGLKAKTEEILHDAYEGARLQAARETPLEVSDSTAPCPWTFAQVIEEVFYPEAPALVENGGGKRLPRKRVKS
jgi:Domain of unknown function DUF29